MQLLSIYRLHLMAVAAIGVVAFAASASGDESTMFAPSAVDWSGSEVRYQEAAQQSPNEEGFNTMARVGGGRSKAELAKPRKQSRRQATAAQLPSMDRHFVITAVKEGTREVHMSELALKHSRSSEVKNAARRIMADRIQATNRLMGIASKKGRPTTGAS